MSGSNFVQAPLDSFKTMIVSVRITNTSSSNGEIMEILRCEPNSTFEDLQKCIEYRHPEIYRDRTFSIQSSSDTIALTPSDWKNTLEQYASFSAGNHLRLLFSVQDEDENTGLHSSEEEVRIGEVDSTNAVSIPIEMNVLSMQKRMSFPSWPHVSITKTTFAQMLEKALQSLNTFEKHNAGMHSGNFCNAGAHTVDDIIGASFNGTTYTKEQVRDLQCLPLNDVLGLDVIPCGRRADLMVYVKHDQGLTRGTTTGDERSEQEEEKTVLQFVSESELISQEMEVRAGHTVKDVKEYICSVYAHATRINTKDVRLILHGQILEDNSVPIVSYYPRVSNGESSTPHTRHLKVHVVVNTEGFFRYDENEPGFWTELFHNPNRFAFMNRLYPQPEHSTRNLNSGFGVTSTSTTTLTPEPVLRDRSVSIPNFSPRAGVLIADEVLEDVEELVFDDHEAQVMEPSYEFCDDEGNEVHLDHEEPLLYRKVKVNSRDYLIEENVIQDSVFEYYLEFDDIGADTGSRGPKRLEVPLPPKSFQLHGNVVLFDHSIIRKIGKLFHTKINSSFFAPPSADSTTPSASTSRPSTALNGVIGNYDNGIADLNSNVRMNDNLVIIPDSPVMETIKMLLFIVCRSLYLVLRSSVLGIIIILQLSTFLPTNYTLTLMGLNFLRNFWVCNELWELWTDFFVLQRLSDYDYKNIHQEIIAQDDIELELLLQLRENPIVQRLLYFGIWQDWPRRFEESEESDERIVPEEWVEFGLYDVYDEESGEYTLPSQQQTMDIVFNSLQHNPHLKHTFQYKKLIRYLILYFKQNLNSWKISGFQQTVHNQLQMAINVGVSFDQENSREDNSHRYTFTNAMIGVVDFEDIATPEQVKELESKDIKDVKKLINVLRLYFRERSAHRVAVNRLVGFFNADLREEEEERLERELAEEEERVEGEMNEEEQLYSADSLAYSNNNEELQVDILHGEQEEDQDEQPLVHSTSESDQHDNNNDIDNNDNNDIDNNDIDNNDIDNNNNTTTTTTTTPDIIREIHGSTGYSHHTG
ncbi:hypothetical protein ACO0QE_000700 [Hanseniaspora vineae]